MFAFCVLLVYRFAVLCVIYLSLHISGGNRRLTTSHSNAPRSLCLEVCHNRSNNHRAPIIMQSVVPAPHCIIPVLVCVCVFLFFNNIQAPISSAIAAIARDDALCVLFFCAAAQVGVANVYAIAFMAHAMRRLMQTTQNYSMPTYLCTIEWKVDCDSETWCSDADFGRGEGGWRWWADGGHFITL